MLRLEAFHQISITTYNDAVTPTDRGHLKNNEKKNIQLFSN